MRKKIILLGFLLGVFLLLAPVSSVQAHGGGMMDENVQDDQGGVRDTLRSMLGRNGASTVDDLNCNNLSDEEMESLGEKVMERMHSADEHKSIDEMMGAEGSSSLKQMHIDVGRAYLGCDGSNYGMGMMSRGVGSMMGIDGFGLDKNKLIFHHYLAVFTWIIFVGFLVSGIYFFLKQSGKKK